MSNVVITGGSRGIGAAAVELFAAKGHQVTFLYEKEPLFCKKRLFFAYWNISVDR